MRSLVFSTVCVYLNYLCLRIEQGVLHHLHVQSHDYRDIPCILVGTTRASQECGQILKKPWYTVYKVLLTKNSLWAQFCFLAVTLQVV